MAGGFQIPRAERQAEDPSKVKRGQFRAPTAGFEAQKQLGGAIAQAGQALGTIGVARQRMQNEESLNNAVNASNEVQNDLVQLLATEKTTAGLDTSGNLERFNEALEASIQDRTADFPDEIKALTRQRLGDYGVRTRTALALHQQEQRRGVTFSNLDQAQNVAIQEAANNPTVGTIEEQLKSVADTISLYRQNGSIDSEEAQDRFTEARQSIVTSAINSASLQNPEAAQALLDQTKAILPAETVKTLETDIRKQAKLQKDEQEAVRTESVQTFTNEIIDQSLEGAATETQMKADPRWQAATPSERKTIESIVRNSNPFNESDTVVLADFTSRVNTEPLELTEQEFLNAHGKGLNTPDFNRLFKQWETKVKEIKKGDAENPLQDGYEKQAYKLIEFMRKDTAFIEPGGVLIGQSDEELAENDLRAAQQVNSLARYIEEHPDEDYVETYIKPVLKPVQEGFISSVYDRVSGFFTDEPFIEAEQDIEVRRQATDLLTEKGVEATRENINRVSAQIQAGNTELKILDAEEARRLFNAASGATKEEKAENARRTAIGQGFIIP